MSKELEALKRIEDFMKVNAKHYKQDVKYIENHSKHQKLLKQKVLMFNFLVDVALSQIMKNIKECQKQKSTMLSIVVVSFH